MRDLGVFCLEKGRLREVLSLCINTQCEGAKKMEPESSQWVSMEGQEAIDINAIKKILFNHKGFIMISTVKCQNRLPKELVKCPFLEILKI